MKDAKNVVVVGSLAGLIIGIGYLIVRALGGRPPPVTGNLHVRVNYLTYGVTDSVYPPGDYTVPIDEEVDITAIPSEGHSIFNWAWSPASLEVTISGDGLTASFAMIDAAVTIQANFQ